MTGRSWLAGMLALPLLLAATAPRAAAEPAYGIVATTGQVADLARNIAGERAEVVGLLGEGVDPHLYKLTRSDIAKLMGADLVLYNGLLLEGKMTDALVRVASAGKPVYAVADALDEDDLLEPPEFQGQYDPHVWMDAGLWAEAALGLRDRLAEHDPEGAATYAANAEAYLAELEELDGYVRRALASVPEESRVMVTAHDAFNYFGRAYGLDVRGIQGISTESQAGVREIEALVGLLVERGVPAVFAETSVSDRNLKALMEGAAARGHEVVLGGKLFSDAMGAPGTYEGTYVGMLDHNATTVALALGGEAPAKGLHGNLSGVETPS